MEGGLISLTIGSYVFKTRGTLWVGFRFYLGIVLISSMCVTVEYFFFHIKNSMDFCQLSSYKLKVTKNQTSMFEIGIEAALVENRAAGMTFG